MRHMDYKYIALQKLERCYTQWSSIISARQAGNPSTISFRKGIPFDEEGYKLQIIQSATDILNQIDWKDPQLIGSKRLLKMARDMLCISTPTGMQQNLVDYRDILFFCQQDSKKLELAFYLLYGENRDEEAFRLLSHLLKQKYALVSYFFFLKDSTKYQVVRPKNFAERFSMVDGPVQSTLVCTWENYQTYNAALEEIRHYLTTQITDEILLTDAHSFLWMFWMFQK